MKNNYLISNVESICYHLIGVDLNSVTQNYISSITDLLIKTLKISDSEAKESKEYLNTLFSINSITHFKLSLNHQLKQISPLYIERLMDLKDVVTEFDERTFLSKINRLCRTKDINAMRFKAYLSASNYEDKETAINLLKNIACSSDEIAFLVLADIDSGNKDKYLSIYHHLINNDYSSNDYLSNVSKEIAHNYLKSALSKRIIDFDLDKLMDEENNKVGF